MRNVAVIGAGAGGQATAAHLIRDGYEVSLYDIDAEKIELIKLYKNGTITTDGAIIGTYSIDNVTTDIKKAVKDADVIMVVTTTDGHTDVAKKLAPIVREEQMIVLCPGQTGGSLVFDAQLKAAGKANIVAEMQDLIYVARSSEPGVVTIPTLKKSMSIAAKTPEELAKVLNELKEVYPQLTGAPSRGVIWFDNMGAMLHPLPMLANKDRVGNKEDFLYYIEGITPEVAERLEEQDAERVAIAAAYGIKATGIGSWQKAAYGVEGERFYDLFQNNKSYATVKAPKTMKHRFVTEDVPSGLVPLEALAEKAGVKVPVISAVIDEAEALLGVKYRETGRSLANLGLEELGPDEIRALMG